jgi:uncharacterized protein
MGIQRVKEEAAIMNENQNILKNLVVISRIDSKIAAVVAERTKLEEKLNAKRRAAKASELDSREKAKAFQDRKAIYEREERHLKESQAKLVDRRKSLTTLGAYKLQMAAEREIEAASKQLLGQEEHFVKMLDQIEELEAAANQAQAAFLAVKADAESFEKEVKDALVTLEERIGEYTRERELEAPQLDERNVATYNRAKERFPMDAVVPLKQNVCGGCFLELGPQMMVEIARGRTLVRCRGCGRILYLEESKEE